MRSKVAGKRGRSQSKRPRGRAALNAASRRSARATLAIKRTLIAALAEWIETEGMTRSEAGAKLSVTAGSVFSIQNRNVSAFTIDTLVTLLLKAGKHVAFAVQQGD